MWFVYAVAVVTVGYLPYRWWLTVAATRAERAGDPERAQTLRDAVAKLRPEYVALLLVVLLVLVAVQVSHGSR